MATTSIYALPYPEPSDPPDVPSDIQALAEAVEGQLQRVDSDITGLRTPQQTSSDLVLASGFSLIEFLGKKIDTVCSVWLYITSNNAITASGGNITDTLMCTLPSGYRPPTYTSAIWGNGTVDGEALIGPDGKVTLRTANGSISAGSNIRLHATFLL